MISKTYNDYLKEYGYGPWDYVVCYGDHFVGKPVIAHIENGLLIPGGDPVRLATAEEIKESLGKDFNQAHWDYPENEIPWCFCATCVARTVYRNRERRVMEKKIIPTQ